MSKGLNIYQLSGLDDNVENSENDGIVGWWNYWTDESLEYENTRSKNYLLSCCNLMAAEANIAKTEAEKITALNTLDFYLVCLYAYNHTNILDENLERAGSILSAMKKTQMFDSTDLTNDGRNSNLNALYSDFDDLYNGSNKYKAGTDIYNWWKKNVIDNNSNNLTLDQQSNFKKYFSKIGDLQDTSFSEYITNAGCYFLYLFIPQSELTNYSDVIKARYKKELEMFEYCCNSAIGTYTREDVWNKIRAGLYACYGMTPEEKIAQLNSLGKTEPIGGAIATSVILAIISAVLAIILAVIGCIQTVLKAKYEEPSNKENGIPQISDFGIDDGSGDGIINNITKAFTNMSTTTKIALAALIGFGIYKFKNK